MSAMVVSMTSKALDKVKVFAPVTGRQLCRGGRLTSKLKAIPTCYTEEAIDVRAVNVTMLPTLSRPVWFEQPSTYPRPSNLESGRSFNPIYSERKTRFIMIQECVRREKPKAR